MDESGRLENEKHKMDYYRGVQSQWNMMQHQVKETNALAMNKKIMLILSEKDAAIRERDLAISETKEALEARDEAFQQRDQALAERDSAMMERDNALAALQYGGNAINFSLPGGNQRGPKRMHHPSNHPVNAAEPSYITDAFPLSAISSECVKPKRSKENNAISSNTSRSPRKGKKVSEDLNRQVPSDGKKIKSEWDSQDAGLNLITFDESSMPVPVCSCTGVPRQCYKWGNGGWQSSCCTTTLSSYPLPQMPNKRHARVGGRKMSGSVFARLLSRVAAEGRDMSVALDLKDYWARHGTNRYITIK